MEHEERKARYLVVLNKETILGDFAEHNDAILFAYISALHGDDGDLYEVYEGMEGIEVGQEV